MKRRFIGLIVVLSMIFTNVSAFATQDATGENISLSITSEAWTSKNAEGNQTGSEEYLLGENSSISSDDMLWYEIDASSLIGKAYDCVKLNLNIHRNWAGNYPVNVYYVTGDWDEETISYANMPSYDKSKSVTTGEITSAEFGNAYVTHTLDVTNMIPAITEENKYIRFVLDTPWTGGGLFKIGGVCSAAYAPSLVFENAQDGIEFLFDGGKGAIGKQSIYIKGDGEVITIPECTYINAGYEFAGWSDGTTTYQPGDSYTVADGVRKLTALWNNTGAFQYAVTKDNAALIVSESWTYNGNIYYEDGTTKNNINTGDGFDYLISGKSYFIYRVDASALIGKSIDKAVIELVVQRNSAGNPTFGVYKTSSEWNAANISSTNLPSVVEATPFTSVTYQNTVSTDDNYIANSGDTTVSLDVTAAFKSVSEDNPLVSIKISGGGAFNAGTKVYGVNTSNAPVIKLTGIENAVKLSFDGNGTSFGKVNVINAKTGSRVLLPENEFKNAGYEFAGWSDGTGIYQAGAEYTMPECDTTLKATWTYSGTATYAITEENAALVSTAGDVTLATSADGVDGIDDEKGQYLYYRIDASDLVGKTLKNVKLNITTSRNYNAHPVLRIFKVTQAWDKNTISSDNLPAHNTTAVFGTQYTIDAEKGSEANPWSDGTSFATLECDITKAFDGITRENPYVTILVEGSIYGASYTSPVFKVKGVNTGETSPKIIVSGINILEDITDGKSFTAISGLSAANIRFNAQIVKTDNMETALPIASLYNGDQLEECFIGDSVNLTDGKNHIFMELNLSEKTITDQHSIKFFVWNSLQNITPLIDAETLN